MKTIKLKTPGDTFKGKVLNVGHTFETERYEKYAIELGLTYVAITPITAQPAHDIEAYNPPKVGETAVFFVNAAKVADGKPHHVGEEISKASRRVGKNGVDVGDTLAGKLVDKITSRKNPS
ncbi:hypothetical protein [Amycolatopsis sp. NPDC051372]|uniref:hypothetical protein n=1 Tax=Amycolatopsis sp. NPDC051372 TaxID=3155669 RepID=UPI00341432DC